MGSSAVTARVNCFEFGINESEVANFIDRATPSGIRNGELGMAYGIWIWAL
ncbi:hypothetical protein [Roseofilum casamattae]|uniref:Uncharacterized protein n=1 Tax=Roseofilum casamattae BLCC-M143 TaxID=3022442 RepID=A0ABT7BYX9_9CYAN|nr:hypothetical protein [Roseofilum casamattae]MDJ1184395.1 hypothetical protein [Roseofilum casamattae BLCC-M143]